MTTQKNLSLPDRIWKFFASVTLAIILIAALALTSIVGTIIEQNAGYEKNIKVLSTFVGEGLAPAAYRIFDAMGFMNMYHSWWFLTLLSLFALNLTICSIDRLPRIWKLVTDPMIPLKENVLRNLAIRKEFTVSASLETAQSATEQVLKGHGFAFNTAPEDGGGTQVFGQKGGYSRLGVYVVHGSILVIFVGSIIGGIFGFKGGLNLPEGATSDVVYLYGSGSQVPLGFEVKCNWYETEFYGSSDQPKLFKSELSVIENGQEILRKWIRVNDPLVYKGVTFYQSSYGPISSPEDGYFVFRANTPGVEDETIWAKKNQPFQIPGTDIFATVVDFSPALGTNRQTGQLYTYTSSMNNPAVKMVFTREGKETLKPGWIWKRWPQTGKLTDEITLDFTHYWGAQFTGLQVRKDPGVWLVYLGCTLMSIALFVAFFMSHRKVWVRIESDRKQTRVLLGASASKNRHSFEKAVDKMVSELTVKSEGGNS